MLSVSEYKQITRFTALLASVAPRAADAQESGQCRIGSERIEFSSLEKEREETLHWFGALRDAISVGQQSGVVENAIVHGSFGDFTQTPFSDLEVTVVINDGCLWNSNRRATVRQWLKETLNPVILTIDPLQHHGPFYLWPGLVSDYNEAILPLAAYRSAWALSPLSLTFTRRDNRERDSSFALRATLSSLRSYRERYFREGVTPYSIKRLISNLVLLPAFLLQRDGAYRSKSEAIAMMLNRDIPAVSDVLDLCTTYRREWPTPPRWLGRIRGIINKGQIPSGRADLLAISTYRDRTLQKSVEKLLLPKIPAYCAAFEELARSHANC